jgi:hypothetical protein
MGEKGSRKPLLSPRCQQPALHAQFLHAFGEAEAIHEHADGAHQGGLVDENAIRRRGDVITAGGADIVHHHVEGNLGVFAAQATHLVVDLTGLDGTTARAVDAQHHTLGVLVIERAIEGGDQGVRPHAILAADLAFQLDKRGMGPRRGESLAFIGQQKTQDDEQPDEAQGPEEHAPATRSALLGQVGQQQAFQGAAFRVLVVGHSGFLAIDVAVPLGHRHGSQPPALATAAQTGSGSRDRKGRHGWRRSSIAARNRRIPRAANRARPGYDRSG